MSLRFFCQTALFRCGPQVRSLCVSGGSRRVRSGSSDLRSAPRIGGRFNVGKSAGKPDPVVDGHLSGTDIAAGLTRSTRDVAGGPPCPCSTLLRMGFAEPPRSPGTLVVSYTTVSPLPVPPGCEIPEGHRRSALCCTFRRVAPPGSYPASCPVESGLSSTRRPRPSGELAVRTLARHRSFQRRRAMRREETRWCRVDRSRIQGRASTRSV